MQHQQVALKEAGIIGIARQANDTLLLRDEPQALKRPTARDPLTQPLLVSSGRMLSEFAGSISGDDLSMMNKAIESGCEQINGCEW